MLGRENDIQLGEFNLAITSEHPPAAYSQVSSDVALPNLKWIDGHKPLFKVTLSLVSSIHPPDPHLSEFFNRYYHLHTSMGTEQEEKALRVSITGLAQARPNQMVHFLHIVLNNLCSLLVRPIVAEEAGGWGQNGRGWWVGSNRRGWWVRSRREGLVGGIRKGGAGGWDQEGRS